MGLPVELFVSDGEDINPDLTCSICKEVLEEPTMVSPCEHIFCKKCIEDWRNSPAAKIEGVTCPMDRQKVEELKKPHRFFLNLLNGLQIPCKFKAHGCKEKVKLGELADHYNRCKFNPETHSQCPGGCGAVFDQNFVGHSCVAWLKEELGAAEAEIKANEVKVKDKCQQLKEKEAELKEREEDLEICHQKIEAFERGEPTSRREIRAAQLDEMKKKLDAKDKKLRSKDKNLKGKEEELKVAMENLNLLKHQVASKDEELKSTRRELSKFQLEAQRAANASYATHASAVPARPSRAGVAARPSKPSLADKLKFTELLKENVADQLAAKLNTIVLAEVSAYFSGTRARGPPPTPGPEMKAFSDQIRTKLDSSQLNSNNKWFVNMSRWGDGVPQKGSQLQAYLDTATLRIDFRVGLYELKIIVWQRG